MRIIITGASRGIGKGIATILAGRGHQVGLLARSEERLMDVAQEITAQMGLVQTQVCDVSDPDQVEVCVKALIAKMGGVDVLINNAAVVTRQPTLEISIEDWQAMMNTNINGAFYCTRQVLPLMKEQGAGHIVNISSISGYHPLSGGAGYAASKYALTGFSESLFQEVRQFGIKVTTVFPGSVNTGSARHDADADHSWKVQPEEVGEAIGDLIETRQGNLISRLEIRPLNKP